MKNSQIFLFLFFAATFQINVKAQIPDSSTAKLVVLSRAHVTDIIHVAIDLKFDWQRKQAYGTTSVSFSVFKPADKITLDAGMLTILAITLSNGKPLNFAYDGGDKDDGLAITLDRIYRPGEVVTVKIEYRTGWINESDPNNIWGSFGKGIRFFEPTSTEPKKRKQIWSTGDPESNRYWYPSYDHPNDLRTSEFTATVDSPLTVIANGRLIEVRDNRDGTRSFHWKMDKPYANHLTSFVIGEYVDSKQNYGNIPLHNFSYPDEARAAAASVVRLPDMMKFFSTSTGVDYPWPSYTQVFVQDFAGWAGNMTFSTITENMVDDEGTHADYLYLWDITEGEALAQQWFGNYILCGTWSDIWLSKSFARYFSGLYNEYKNGRDEFLMYQLTPDQGTYFADWQSGLRQPVVNTKYENTAAFTGANQPYFHGASVLHLLRKHLGEEIWWKAIRMYLKEHAGRKVTTENFRQAVEDASGQPMDWFFDQWVYKTGHPFFEVTKKYDAAKKELTLRVKQTQKREANASYEMVHFFRGMVAIEIDQRIEEVWLSPQEENVFVFASPQEPRLVNFDFESSWIKEIRFDKTFDELLYQLQHSKDILARMQAMTELASLAGGVSMPGENRSGITMAFKQVIQSKAYWRLRTSALFQLQNLYLPADPTGRALLDKGTVGLLLDVIKRDSSWVRASAIRFLGTTRDPKYADIYINALYDKSDRVANAAAVALGKSKSPKAFNALIRFKDKPSWKNQSLISALNGLKELGDPRGFELALRSLTNSSAAHWTLGTSVWDHRLAAAETLVALGQSDKGYLPIFEQFKKAMEENDVNDIFYNALQVTTLADPRGVEVFQMLEGKFRLDENAMTAVGQLKQQFENNIKKSQ